MSDFFFFIAPRLFSFLNNYFDLRLVSIAPLHFSTLFTLIYSSIRIWLTFFIQMSFVFKNIMKCGKNSANLDLSKLSEHDDEELS